MRNKKRRGLKLLGAGRKTKYVFDNPTPEVLEVFENPQSLSNYVVQFQTDEVTALCPITSQPDFYEVRITYIPDKWCIESKSLKLYLFSLRSSGGFIEDLANMILYDLVKVCQPQYMKVVLIMKPRGGIKMTVCSIYRAEI